MILLALDNATIACGWAVFEGDKLRASGVLKASPKQHIDERLKWLRNEILGLVNTNAVDHVVFEDTMLTQKGHNNLQTFKKLCWLQGMIAAICFEKGISCNTYMPSEWRSKIGFLKGRSLTREAQKQVAIDFVKARFGKEVTDDEAEAICLGFSSLRS